MVGSEALIFICMHVFSFFFGLKFEISALERIEELRSLKIAYNKESHDGDIRFYLWTSLVHKLFKEFVRRCHESSANDASKFFK